VTLELLQSISLAVAEHQRSEAVLTKIVNGLVDQAGYAVARIWLSVPPPPLKTEYLQLAASAGHSLSPGQADWVRLDGAFSHVVPPSRKIGSIAASGQSVIIDDVSADKAWIVDREWARREQIRSFAGHPLIYRGEVLGVLAVFSRRYPVDREFEWLRLFADHAAVAITNARAFEEIQSLRSRLELENEYLRQEVSEAMGGILGTSEAIRHLIRQIELVAPTEANVLILGESGTGKELAARAIHDRSKRHHHPLVKVNCASIPAELFESEFFGHVKGAFTGALRDRIGRFQLADKGTLFLDEIGEIPLALQSKLLRVLQEGEFERIGEDTSRKVDVRVLAATNRDLAQEVKAGRFRQDLYYRLSVFPLTTPPLRHHMEDVPVLAAHFLRVFSERLHLPAPMLTAANVAALQHYDWPGNVRELQNVIERALILSRGGSPMQIDLPVSAGPAASSLENGPMLKREDLKALERDNIENALSASGGRIYGKGGAAERLGMRPTTLASRIAALGITRKESKR
jgi:transcriptional regulator with GAF, ATPase, and Fis domain